MDGNRQKINQLARTIRAALEKVGGTGCDMTNEQYISEQVITWSTKKQLDRAIACFEELARS